MFDLGGGSSNPVSSIPENLRACDDAVSMWSNSLRLRVGGLRSAVALSSQRYELIRLADLIGSCADGHDQLAVELNRVARAFAEADSNPSSSAVRVAVAEEGYREQATNRTKFGSWFGANGQAWCAMFVSWSFARAGTPLPNIASAKGFSGVRSGWAYATSHDQLVWKPKPGDIFLIRTSGPKGHTGIVVSVNETTGEIQTIEGNTNEKGSREGTTVMQKTRSIASINRGFWRPFGEITDRDRTPPTGSATTWPISSATTSARRRRRR
jgi:hypothetical protein